MQLLVRHLLLLLLSGQHRRLVHPRLLVSHAAQRARGMLLMVRRLLVDLLVALLRLELQVVLLLLELRLELGLGLKLGLLLLTQVLLLCMLCLLRKLLRVVHVLEWHLRRHRLTIAAAVLQCKVLLELLLLLQVGKGRLRWCHACGALLGFRIAWHPTIEAASAARLGRRPAA